MHTSRIKTLESLIDKVIRKRHEWLGDDNSKYAQINVENYKNIITDLAGLRIIINYRGHWQDIHDNLLKLFPILPSVSYEKISFSATFPDTIFKPSFQRYIMLKVMTLNNIPFGD